MTHPPMTSSPASHLSPAHDCLSCPVRSHSLCRLAAMGDVGGLQKAWRNFSPGQELFYQGEACLEAFTIVRGWAFLYELLEDGRRQIVQFALPGDLVGLHPAQPISPFGAQAVDRVDVCVVPRGQIIEAAQRQSSLAFGLACLYSSEGSRAYDRLTAVGRKTAEERAASLLLELFYRVRRRAPRGAGDVLRIPLTQTHLADALGLTAIHVNRTLGRLRQKGVIDYGNGLFHILAPARLFEIAGIDPEDDSWPAAESITRHGSAIH